ncbi:proto-oncogene tyrosine-protein kinase ROS isoform X2 [Harpegnathos saltator]|uniref:proto-oncogene tyrosine-protein kinase ROS isoform X2 n=1 Tax=Harpegnathos saltator TaxID=610380 RepID=UPI00058D4DAE|nr:proto-oncogene tyrosine-protein kinase ROS isoform X2 [Harpegnathos saltator]
MLGTGLCALLKVLVLAGVVAAFLPDDDENIVLDSLEEECASKCPDLTQNRTDDASSEVECGVRCKIEQCMKGCDAWQQALDTSCQAVCNGTQERLPPKELYCVLGCNDALNRYFQQLRAEIGTPPAPALVADSLTATSLSLEWKGVDIKRRAEGISYLVQWRYEELAETWQYCRNQTWGEGDQILVENLQPYTNYRFRVAMFLKSSQHNPELIVSAPSVVILTRAEGLPTSAPVIVRAAAVDSYRVSVSWEPGPFPNGPLLSYVLRLQGADHSQLKDIPASENTTRDHYMFRNLKSKQNYTVSVTMRNGVGEGPPAIICISTTPEPTVKDTQKPILILGGKHMVMKQDAEMMDEPSIIYQTAAEIRGVAIHIASSQLFVSTSTSYVYRTSITELSEPGVILSPDQVNFEPLSLSVDWLNHHLYVLGQVNHSKTVWQIARCNLDGRGLTVAVAGFVNRPSHIEVDPYNGYLFWIIEGKMYRLDLADISNGVKHEVKPSFIYGDSNMNVFTVDHMNFRLLVPNHTLNTVMSMSLDGRESVDIRANIQKPLFNHVVSLAVANKLFYWTNGQEVLTEVYHSGQNRYFHNSYKRSDIISVNVLMNASQPVPIPVNPPTGVQAVLGAERAKVSWQAPHLLGGQGKGAWQNWSYELEIREETSNYSSSQIIRQRDIVGSSHTVHNLRESSQYYIRVAAYTSAGRGPWSTEFRGRTLRNGSRTSILWSSNEGLLKSDVTGENIDTLIDKTSLKESGSEFHIVDVSWYKDVLYFVGNNTALYRYNVSSHQRTKLMNSVAGIAVDWISKKLYWAYPKNQIIVKANLDGTHQDPMSIITTAKELTIDSLEAYLYWSTGHDVQVVRLNEQDKRYYHSDEIFNGKQVMGLTLDFENRYVYWIVRSYVSGSIVYRAPTSEQIPMSQKIVPEKVSALHVPNLQGPLCYFSEHLLWLQDEVNAVIGDLSGQNTAVINGITLSGLHMVAVMDPAFHRYPRNLTSENIVVSPDPVDFDSIRVEGTWRNFSVSWDPVKNVNYGTVFYEVKFTDLANMQSSPEITIDTTIPYNNSDRIVPYSLLEVIIKPFTYWETSYQSRKILRSPQSWPSEPTYPRTYVEFCKRVLSENVDIFATFRWSKPQFTNGLIQGYTVQSCWEEIGNCKNHSVAGTTLEFTAHGLLPNTTYYFQVRAHTEIGAGPWTNFTSVLIASENPVPQILVATMDAVKLADLDQKINYTITRHIAIEVSYSVLENKMYWINDMQELVTSEMNGANATKILALNNTAQSLCIDWVAKNLYWSESSAENGGRIMKLDLTMWQVGVVKYENIVRRGRNILNLDILPSRGSLYWVESTKSSRGTIMQSDLDGNNVMLFFRNTESALAKECSCQYSPSVKPVMTIDKTSQKPMMYWMSSEGYLNVADIYGCMCDTVLNANSSSGTSLTVDKMNVYWSDAENEQIYLLSKSYFSSAANNKANASGGEEPGVKSFHLSSMRSIKAFGKSLQPYPAANCLTPRRVAYRIEKLAETASSIFVRLPEPIPDHGCESYSLPTTLYTIHVSQCLDNDSDDDDGGGGGGGGCERHEVQTHERQCEIRDLKPFTEYRLKLALSNYYGNLTSANLEFDSGVVFRTGPGKPSVPEHVTVEALTPTLAAVYWMPPRILNSAEVNYEVHWRSADLVNGLRQKGEQLIKELKRTADGRFYAMLRSLLPGREYAVYVRVYSVHSNEFYNQSVKKNVQMYPEPSNLTLSGVSVNNLNVSWIPSVNLTVGYLLEYRDIGTKLWQTANNAEMGNDMVTYHIENLQPHTSYKFRLVLRYPVYKEDFIWPPGADGGFTFETLGDVPSAPGTPTVVMLRNSLYQLNWEPAQAHGSPVTLYVAEGMIVDDSYKQDNKTDMNEHWTLYHNGTDSYWIITGNMDHKYRFRVRAQNAYGFGDWSRPSAVVDLTESAGGILAAKQHLGLALGLSVVVITLMLLCLCYFICLFKQRKEDKKAVLPPIVSDVELATLREIPRGNFVQSNALYASTLQNDPDDSALPKIRREQITLAKFLGSGAFGKVYQGKAKDLEGSGVTPVAIKTLREGASSQEKTEFLQEARLMSHFRHKHVLRLLGVCLDTDPPLLVLELMEAGDLLSYLRDSRSLQPTDTHALRLQDLLAMCEDVARGCRYLEELHFVHRDLACRNCLVSARDRENRVVKIGDFGLARDIYKNDYYRKEGEGLLPVRWMPPESLVDGVFTSQSDVWAFGVLMWEITTLGQQPYPAMTNFEVLHHVSAGNRLPRPLNCPPALHQLMLRCWSVADARPSFKVCLDNIVALRRDTEDAVLSPVHAGHVARRGNSWRSSSSDGSRDMQPFLQNANNATQLSPHSGDIPKYLEVLADNEADIILRKSPTSGYEVPRSIHISDQNLANISKFNCASQDRKCSLPSEIPRERKQRSMEERKRSDGTLYDKRSSIASLNSSSDRRGASSALSEKSDTLDSGRLANYLTRTTLKRDSFSSLNEQRKYITSLSERRDSEATSLDGRSCSSLSLAPSTRPSSSLINSQATVLPTKNNVGANGEVPASNAENAVTKNALPSIQRTPHSNLQTSKANIPLVINSALLNLLRQKPVVDDSNNIVTYTNINAADAVRVNGS